MLLDNHGSFSRNIKKYIFGVSGVMFDMKDSLKGLEESASHLPPSTRGSAPSLGMFSSVIMCCNGIGDKSVTLGNQNNMSGVRGSPWDGLDRKIVLEKMVRSTLLEAGDPSGAPTVTWLNTPKMIPEWTIYGAKHSPPGHQGAPDCPEGVPPVCRPGPPLIHDISGSSSSNEEFSTSTLMIFDALSDGIYAVSPTCREQLRTRHDFVKIMKKCQKSMFPKMAQEHSGDV